MPQRLRSQSYKPLGIFWLIHFAKHVSMLLVSVITAIFPSLQPIQLKWDKKPGMPFEMSEGIQSIFTNGKVYVGGGRGLADHTDSTVMEFDTATQEWDTLPPYSAIWFAMVGINDQLVLVGGYEEQSGREGQTSKKLGVWNKSSWIYPYPLMSTARCGCSAVVDNHWLAIAGGSDSDLNQSFVEVLNTNTRQWHTTVTIPIPWTDMKSAIVDNTCYFIGGYNLKTESPVVKNYCIPMQALFHFNSSETDMDSSKIDMWKEIPVEKDHSSPLAINDCLIAFGGFDFVTNCAVSSIYLYQPDHDPPRWVIFGDLPSSRYHCTSTKITNREIFVAGGSYYDNITYDDCYIAQIC